MFCIGHSWEYELGELEFPKKDNMVCKGHSWEYELGELRVPQEGSHGLYRALMAV